MTVSNFLKHKLSQAILLEESLSEQAPASVAAKNQAVAAVTLAAFVVAT